MSAPVAVIELLRDEDGAWRLVLPHVEGSDDLDVLDTLSGLTRLEVRARFEGREVSIGAYTDGARAWVTWDAVEEL